MQGNDGYNSTEIKRIKGRHQSLEEGGEVTRELRVRQTVQDEAPGGSTQFG